MLKLYIKSFGFSNYPQWLLKFDVLYIKSFGFPKLSSMIAQIRCTDEKEIFCIQQLNDLK